MRQQKNVQMVDYKDFYPSRTHFYYFTPLIKVEEDVQFVQECQQKLNNLQNHLQNLFVGQQNQLDTPTAISNHSNSSSLSVLGEIEIKKNYLNDFIFVKTIGKGTFGKVEKLKYNYIDSYVAAKVIFKIPRETFQKAKLMRLHNQIQIYKKISHPNFVELISVYEWKKQVTLIMELAKGNILNFMARQHPTQQIVIAKIMYQIFDALSYLDKLNIVHRDIKAENIVYDEKTEIIKIVDFGQAICLRNQHEKFDLGGTFAYFAPQSFQHNFSHKSDTWACGVLLYYLLSTKLIFLEDGKSKLNIKQNILNKNITFENNHWNQRSNQVKQLILRLLQRNVDNRITAQQAKNSQWIRANIKDWRPPFQTTQQKRVRKNQSLTSSILKDLNQHSIRSSPSDYKKYLNKTSNKGPSKFRANLQSFEQSQK